MKTASISATTGDRQDSAYMPGLDGLRAVAVFAVLLTHFLPSSHPVRILPLGRLGVVLFFVLSGFLITGILLRYRDHALNQNGSRLLYCRIFYARRALRIFPIYYLTLIVLLLVEYPPIKNYLFWHLFYVSNISMALLGGQYEYTGHFWSLCVEEQFYLLWPSLVFIAPPHALHRIILSMIATAVVFKLLVVLPAFDGTANLLLLPGCLDSLGLGALLSLYRHDIELGKAYRAALLRWGILIGLPLLLILMPFRRDATSSARMVSTYFTLIDIAASAFYVVLIDAVSRSAQSSLICWLSWRPVRYMGKISYGIYLYHLLLLPLLPWLVGTFGLAWPNEVHVRFFLYFSTTIALAAASWHLIEVRFNHLKKYFSPMLDSG